MNKIDKATSPDWTWNPLIGDYEKIVKEKPPEIIHQEKREPGRKRAKFSVKTS